MRFKHSNLGLALPFFGAKVKTQTLIPKHPSLVVTNP
jgi:hypothetical protein